MTEFKARFVSKRPHMRSVARGPEPIALPPAEPTKPLPIPSAMQAYYARQAEKSAAERPFVPSVEQSAYFDWITDEAGSALVEAVAGSGKTTTLVQGLPRMEGSIFFGAFGKDAATDIQHKTRKAGVDRQGIRMSTMHSAGFGAFRQAFKKVAVDDRKVGNIIRSFAQTHPRRELIERSTGFVAQMVSFGRQYLFGCDGFTDAADEDAWRALCEHFGKDADLTDEVSVEEALDWTRAVYKTSHAQCPDLIDFDDMIYAPIAFGCHFFQNDWVIGDEWQDANLARREIARRLLKPRYGRAVFVGDDRQSIFGFTGAQHDSLEETAKIFNCKRLSLSVTYRCPKTVVDFVKKTIDPTYTIRAHENARDGVVRDVLAPERITCTECNGSGVRMRLVSDTPNIMQHATCAVCKGAKQVVKPWFLQDRPNIEDAILCRYTKPLIATAYAMIKNGIACKVEGRDLGKNLIALARLWKITNIKTLKERLSAYLTREIEKARLANSEKREQEITDRVETLGIFIERCKTLGKSLISDVVYEIELLFADNVTDMIRLSTGHKAKGREWNRVFWLRTQRRQQKKEWETLSERNVEIVIGTRPLEELILVPETVHSRVTEKKK